MERIDKTLYAKDAKGKMRYWRIFNEFSTIYMKFGCVGGAAQLDSEYIFAGLAGRTIEEQVKLRIDSRTKKKMDSGYVATITEAEGGRKNALGMLRPMLATSFDKTKDFKYGQNYVQRKYDGHRCLIVNIEGVLVAYSRNGKSINSIDHILDEMEIPEGVTIDGELYCHGIALQTISSLVRKPQEDSKKLKYICYDLVSDGYYPDRLKSIRSYTLGEFAETAQTTLLVGSFDIKGLLRVTLDQGYEGLVIRPDGYPYESGKRSKGLIKVKSWLDDEYVVHKITGTVDGFARLHCKHNGKEFKVTCPGNHEEKRNALNFPAKYLGKKVNVQYANLTSDGIPFHPVATIWRNKEDE